MFMNVTIETRVLEVFSDMTQTIEAALVSKTVHGAVLLTRKLGRDVTCEHGKK
jgi:hypothetical protein